MRVKGLDLAGVLLALIAGSVAVGFGADAFLIVVAVVVLVAVARTRRRFGGVAVHEEKVVLPLVLLPTVMGLAVFSEQRVVLIVGALVLVALIQGRWRTARIHQRWLVVALGASILLPASRFATSSTAQLWHLGAFLVLLVCVIRFPFPAVVLSLIDGVGLYLLANVAAHLAGISSPAATSRTFGLESSTGGVRVFFPLSASLATPPLLAAAFVAAGLICFEGRPLHRAARIAAFLAGSYIMVAANTRAALVVSVLVLLASVITPRLFARLSVLIAAVPMIVAFVYPVVAAAVIGPFIHLASGALPFLSRGNVSADVALEGRSDIWTSAVAFWQTDIDSLHQLVGFGELGQRRSGASLVFAHGDSVIAGFSTHNSTLQQLYDGGLVGVVALVAAGLGSCVVLASQALRASRVHLVALCALVASLMGGGTEVTQSPGYSTEAFWVFAGLVLAAATVARRRSDAEAWRVVDDNTRRTARVAQPLSMGLSVRAGEA